MPWSRSDSLRLFLTGAAADGGAQADPTQSLGNYRSTTIAGSAPFLPPNLPGVLVVYVSQAAGAGDGSLIAADANSLSFAAPGDSPGPAVSVANGQTVLLESASSPNAFAVVTRTTAASLAGSATLSILEELFNDAVGQSNATLPAAAPTHRALMLKNGPTQTLKNLRIWLGPVTNPTQIALETPSSQPAGHLQTIASETTAPTGLTFAAPTSATDAAVLSVPTLLPNQIVGLWIRRNLSAAAAAAGAQTGVCWSYTAAG